MLKLPIAACVLALVAASGHDLITTKLSWSREVSRIVFRRCASCHREGGSAFALTSYKDARPWARAISEQVLTRRMPPWNAVKGFGDLKDDRGLSQEEIGIIGAWVEGGAPEGDPADMPPVPPASARRERAEEGRRITVQSSLTLKEPAHVIGIRPARIPETGSLRVIARYGDGSLVPLLWVQDFNPEFETTYYLQDPLALAQGVRIEVWPASGEISLVLK